MKSYEEITENVLRRRDEQIAKKRRRIAVAGSVLPVSMLTLAVVVGVAALQGGVPEEGYTIDVGSAAQQQTWENENPLVQLIGQRLIFTENGENIDITDMINDDTPYVYENVDTKTGLVSYVVIGGTPENYGWARFSMYERDTEQPENSKWNNSSRNTFTADRQDCRWYGAAISQLSEKAENAGIIKWSMTERAWELVLLDENEEIYSGLTNATVAEDSLGGYCVSLEMAELTHRPTYGEDYYSAEDVILNVWDENNDDNRIRVSLGYYDIKADAAQDFFDRLNRVHAKDSLKLLELTDESGKKHYVIMLRNYVHNESYYNEDGAFVEDINDPYYATMFFALDAETFERGYPLLYILDAALPDGAADTPMIATDEPFDVREGTLLAEDTKRLVEFDPDNLCFIVW